MWVKSRLRRRCLLRAALARRRRPRNSPPPTTPATHEVDPYLGGMERLPVFEHLDELTIVVAFGERPDAPADQVFTLSTNPSLPPGHPWDEQPYLDLLLPILAQENSPHPPFHSLDVRKSQTSGGASGAGAQIALFIYSNAATGVIGALAWEGIKTAFQEISKRAASRGSEPPLTLEQAITSAKWRIVMAYQEIAFDGLTVISEEQLTQKNSWVIRLEAPDGTPFEVELGVVGGNPYTSRIKRGTAPRTEHDAND